MPGCLLCYLEGSRCERCSRLAAVGVLVRIVMWFAGCEPEPDQPILDGLDAVATVVSRRGGVRR